jgi:hypothetical protein
MSKQEMKMPKMAIGIDNFRTLLFKSDVFVDKSLLIKELIEDPSEVILITRPRRWGKSMNMDMMRCFFSIEVDLHDRLVPEDQKINPKLFAGGDVDIGFGKMKKLKPLKIANDSDSMEHQGKYPVIYINFKDIKGSSYDEIERAIKNQIIKLFIQHRYLKELIKNNPLFDEQELEKLHKYYTNNIGLEDIKDALGFLSSLLFKYFNQKVYILIDEYDTPINSAYLKFTEMPQEFEKILELFRGILGSALKTNPHLEKAVITGILRIAKANLFSDLNNIREYCVLDKKFSKFYGFTENEVNDLLSQVPTKTSKEEIKYWYNGYSFGEEIIYNPWSIMLCLSSEGELDHYWVDSGGTGLIDEALLRDDIQEDLQKLVEGGSIIETITKHINFNDINTRSGLFSLLLFAGYLKPQVIEFTEHRYELSIPNFEVQYIYRQRIMQWVNKYIQLEIGAYYNFASLLPICKLDEFKTTLQSLLLTATSFYQTGEKSAELFYNGFMLGLVMNLSTNYIITSEHESGKGRADLTLIAKAGKQTSAIILEYKIAKNIDELDNIAKIGLKQINQKQYDIKLKEYSHIKKIIKISIGFFQKQASMEYQIDEV